MGRVAMDGAAAAAPEKVAAKRSKKADATKVVNLGYELVDPSTLKEHPRNARRGNIKSIDESVGSNGFYGAIVVQKSTRTILKGNHTYQVAVARRMASVPVIWVEVDAKTEQRILIADNRTSDLAGYEDKDLLALLVEMQSEHNLVGTGYNDDAVMRMIASSEEGRRATITEDTPPPVPKVAETKVGDLYRLGDHLLVCADSKTSSEVERVMGGALADMVWTDPPYGVAYKGGTAEGLTIENDDLDAPALREFLRTTLGVAYSLAKPGSAWYVAAPSGNLFLEFAAVLGREGFDVWKHTIVWVKDSLVLGRADYHYRHESIFYGWKEGAGHFFIDDRKQDTVWEIARPKKSTDHPTMKPVELVARAIQNNTVRGGIVLDVFGGSGTTLIAAEQTGRSARLVEKSPNYCDVIVKRWQALTGRTAEKL